MAVSKFYAVWRKESGEEEIVNAFQALALKGRAQNLSRRRKNRRLFLIWNGSQG